jgi:polyhydroxyalkanoate synthesis regulator protein
MRHYINNALGGMFPFGSLEEMSRRNMEFLDQAFRAFNPLMPGKGAAQPGDPGAKPAPSAPPPEPAKEKAKSDDTLSDLQKKIDALEKQIEAMGKKE